MRETPRPPLNSARKTPEILSALLDGKGLQSLEAREFMDSVLQSELNDELVAFALGALQARGPTADELVGFCQSLLSNAQPVTGERKTAFFDCCGTGGDGAGTFNLSTAVSFVLAGAGVAVAKHGNRSVSSQSGSSDVIGSLGIDADQALHMDWRFLFAPKYHPILAKIAPLRKKIGRRTVFNILGPLLNPIAPSRQMMGVYATEFHAPIAQAARSLGRERFAVLTGGSRVDPHLRLDEVSLLGATQVTMFADGAAGKGSEHGIFTTFEIVPEDFGLSTASSLEGILCSGPEQSAEMIRAVLDGAKGEARDWVVLNTAFGLWVAGKVGSTLTQPTQTVLNEARRLAEDAIDSGAARRVLQAVQGTTNAKSAQRAKTPATPTTPTTVQSLDPGVDLNLGKDRERTPRRSPFLAEIRELSKPRIEILRTSHRRARLFDGVDDIHEGVHESFHECLFDGLHGTERSVLPAIIAEVKLASPALGHIAQSADPGAIARLYFDAGARGVSVLTEPHRFKGSPDYLKRARELCPGRWILMKDFIDQPEQLVQAREIGASAALLIVAYLERAQLKELYDLALTLGIEPLVEAHDEKEAEAALALGAKLIGINNRNLETLVVDPTTCLRVASNLRISSTAQGAGPSSGVRWVAESGIDSRERLLAVRQAGFSAALVGSALMKQGDPAAGLRDWLRERS